MNLSLESLRALVQDADHVEVVGEPRLRLTQLLGLTALGVATIGMGALAAWNLGTTHQAEPFQAQIRNEVDERPMPPSQPYRLEVTDPQTGQTVTRVAVDPAQWSPMDQTAFVLKLGRQADARAMALGHSLVLSVSSEEAQAQAEAQRFVKGTLQMDLPPPTPAGVLTEAVGLHFQDAAVAPTPAPRASLGQTLGLSAPAATPASPRNRAIRTALSR